LARRHRGDARRRASEKELPPVHVASLSVDLRMRRAGGSGKKALDGQPPRAKAAGVERTDPERPEEGGATNPGRYLKSAFSPYGIAVLGLVLCSALALIGMLGVGTGRIGGGILLLLAALVGSLAFDHASRCPGCGKSPMKRDPGELGWFALYVMKYRYRWWPERQCSACRAELDMIPQ
jgi:hypothetical protein